MIELNRMMEFNRLPLEVQVKTFSFLFASDVMKIRLVCKQWNNVIKCELKLKRLNCFQLGHNKPYDFRDRYDFYFEFIMVLLDYASKNAMFSRVKHLDALLQPTYADLENSFDFLNSFKSLKETWFTCNVYAQHPSWNFDELDVRTKTFSVNLADLEKANFGFYWNSEPDRDDETGRVSFSSAVMLNLPSLRYLAFGYSGMREHDPLIPVTVGYPEKLKTFAAPDLFRKRTLDYSKFTNLQTIYTDLNNKRFVSGGFIEKLPGLKALQFMNYPGSRTGEDQDLLERTYSS